VYFTLGGADANETAVKLARWAARKEQGLIVTRDRSYHGASYAGIALSRRRAHRVAETARDAGRPARAAALCLSLPVRRPHAGGKRAPRRGRGRRHDLAAIARARSRRC
jgi:4-aminobutyrate aminotransferase-like enzyme